MGHGNGPGRTPAAQPALGPGNVGPLAKPLLGHSRAFKLCETGHAHHVHNPVGVRTRRNFGSASAGVHISCLRRRRAMQLDSQCSDTRS